MVSKAVVGRMLKPFVAGRDELVVCGKSLVLLPITTGVRSVVFHGSMHEKEALWPATSAMPTHGLFGVFGRAIVHFLRPEGGFYETDDPDYPKAVWTMLEERALPELAAIRTPKDYVAFNDRGFRPVDFSFMKLAFAVVSGDFATAATHCERRVKDVRVQLAPDPNATSRRKRRAMQSKRDAEAIAFWETKLKLPPLSHEVMDRYAPGLMERFSEEGDAMSDNDKRALVAALRRLERDNIVRAGLEPFWQKVEWPVEAMLGIART